MKINYYQSYGQKHYCSKTYINFAKHLVYNNNIDILRQTIDKITNKYRGGVKLRKLL